MKSISTIQRKRASRNIVKIVAIGLGFLSGSVTAEHGKPAQLIVLPGNLAENLVGEIKNEEPVLIARDATGENVSAFVFENLIPPFHDSPPDICAKTGSIICCDEGLTYLLVENTEKDTNWIPTGEGCAANFVDVDVDHDPIPIPGSELFKHLNIDRGLQACMIETTKNIGDTKKNIGVPLILINAPDNFGDRWNYCTDSFALLIDDVGSVRAAHQECQSEEPMDCRHPMGAKRRCVVQESGHNYKYRLRGDKRWCTSYGDCRC